ncbi:hypothetical protein [Micromonospora profundi]|uniref:hypothetical protein n=1 Tax=Micromonospora profundi TaxID=1420889 RepID=UPI0036584AF0
MTATSKTRTFTMIPDELFDLVADGKISKNAAWLYAALLRHHNRKRGDNDVWPARSSLARALGLKKPDSVDGYMDELKALGLVTATERRKGGMKLSSRYTLHLIAGHDDAPAADTPKSGARYPEMGATVTPEQGYELDEPQLHEENLDRPCTEENRSPSTRFAPSGAGDFDSQTSAVDDQPPIPQQRGNWYLNDRDDFRAALGDQIISQGVKKWNRGTFPTNAVYDALRQRPDNPIDRPGSYVASLVSGRDGDALDNWLLREGFSLPERAV